MKLNRHPELEGLHAILSPSSNAWLRYDDAKMIDRIDTKTAAARGTRLHEVASELISLKIKLPRSGKTLNQYVNDAIGFDMIPELPLFYTFNAFGTADAIRFDEKKSLLRISDLKTGTTPVTMDQLEIYVALFCLEYSVRPGEIRSILRIYQNDEVWEHEPEPDRIAHIIGEIIRKDKIIRKRQEETQS